MVVRSPKPRDRDDGLARWELRDEGARRSLSSPPITSSTCRSSWLKGWRPLFGGLMVTRSRGRNRPQPAGFESGGWSRSSRSSSTGPPRPAVFRCGTLCSVWSRSRGPVLIDPLWAVFGEAVDGTWNAMRTTRTSSSGNGRDGMDDSPSRGFAGLRSSEASILTPSPSPPITSSTICRT